MKILFIPMYSMRSHEDGAYKMLKDGNFQSVLSRMLDLVKTDDIHCTFPFDTSDFNDVQNILKDVPINFMPVEYGLNAMDTRENFWKLNPDFIDEKRFDYVVTDIGGFPYKNIKFINNFNISKIKGLERSYVDKFFDIEVESALKAESTIVINEAQRLEFIFTNKWLDNKVYTNKKLLNPDIYKYFTDNTPIDKEHILTKETLFWPFRLTDKAYQFEWVYSYLKANHNMLPKGFEIVVTDPNNTLDQFQHLLSNIIPVRKITPSKAQYYKILEQKPLMIMLDDIDKVLHPGLIEFLYFKCRIITLRNNTIRTNLQIANKLQLLGILNYVIEFDPLLEVDNINYFLIKLKDSETFLFGVDRIIKEMYNL